MRYLRPYSSRDALYEIFIRQAIGPSLRHQALHQRTFSVMSISCQKLSRKQREVAGATPTPEDQERIRKAQERAAQRSLKQEQARLRGNSAQRLLKQIQRQQGLRSSSSSSSSSGGSGTKADEKKAPENEEVEAEKIDLIDREGRYIKGVWKVDVLADLDYKTETLMLVKSVPDGQGNPVCKVFNLESIAEKKRKQLGRQAELAKGEKSAKELELTWTIGPADLDLKCKRIVEFLEEGRRVTVTVTRKFKRRAPERTVDEMEGLVEHLRQAVKRVKGARELKASEGQLAHTMDLFFQGPPGGIKERQRDEDVEQLIEPKIAGAAAS